MIEHKKPYDLNRLEKEPWLIRLINVHNIIKKVLKKEYYYRSAHGTWDLNKHILRKTFKLFNKIFVKMLETQRFRTYNEHTYEFLTLSTIMSAHLKLSKNVNNVNKIFVTHDPLTMEMYNTILNKRPYVFVINELDESQKTIWKLIQDNYMKKDEKDTRYNDIVNYVVKH